MIFTAEFLRSDMVRVLTYNVSLIFPDHKSMDRADKIRYHLIRGNYDLVGLCEVYNPLLRKILIENDEMKTAYPYQVYGLEKFGSLDNGTVLFSKYPLIGVNRFEYPNPDNAFLNSFLPPKDLIFCFMEYQGKEIGVFLTHLQWGNFGKYSEIRRFQIRYLAKMINRLWSWKRPFIIFGDLNIYEKSGDRDYLLSQLDGIQDWYDATNDREEDPGYTWSLDNHRILYYYTEERFDYILSNKLIKPIFTAVLKFKLDHFDKKTDLGHASMKTKIFYWTTKILQVLFFPIYLLVRGVDWLIKYSRGVIRSKEEDLSDHYALVGEGELAVYSIDNIS